MDYIDPGDLTDVLSVMHDFCNFASKSEKTH